MNNPPTAVGGIQRERRLRSRPDLNNPPTAVEGIRRTVQPYPGAHGSLYRIEFIGEKAMTRNQQIGVWLLCALLLALALYRWFNLP